MKSAYDRLQESLGKLEKPKYNLPKKKKKPYEFGDITKGTLSTYGDIAANVGKGFLGATESVVDLGRYGVAGVADLLGADKYADDVRKRAMHDTTGFLTKPADDLYNKRSALKEGGLTESVAQGLGQVGAMVGSSALLPGSMAAVKVGKFALPTSSILMGAGGGMTEAYNSGSNDLQALGYGLTKGAIEGGTEAMFGGLGKTFNKFTGGGALDEVVSNRISSKLSGILTKKGVSNVTNRVLTNLVNAGVMASGEGIEEVVSSLLDPLAKKIYSDKSLKEMYKDQNLMQDFIVGALTSGILQAPGTITNIQNGNSNVSNGSLSNQTTNLDTQKPNIPTVQDIVAQEQIKNNSQLTVPNIESQNVLQNNNQVMLPTTENIETKYITKTEEQELQEFEKSDDLLDEEELQRYEYLQGKKEQSIIGKDLIGKTSYDKIKNVYGKYKNLDNFDSKPLDKVNEIIAPNKSGRKTKEQWLDTANMLGNNLKNMNSQELEKYAIQSFFYAQPNQKDNLNRQGKKYVKFTMDEWLDSFYKGANVGGLNYSEPNLPTKETVQNSLQEQPTQMFQYVKSDNAQVNTLNESIAKYFDNSQKTQDMSDTISKIVKDKGYTVEFDDTITAPNGNFVNALVSADGKTIKLNPNSPRAVEFLLIHEMTHSIETKEMRNLVLDYAKKNPEFNQAIENLKKTYGTDDVSAEVVADISGQLFGNQEFINNLSMEKPNVFKRIYAKIVEIANKLTGNSNEALFMRDLKNKWETAYRTQNKGISGDTQYSLDADTKKEIKQLKSKVKSLKRQANELQKKKNRDWIAFTNEAMRIEDKIERIKEKAKKKRYSLQEENIKNNKDKALYVLNKEAKRIRDARDEIKEFLFSNDYDFPNEISDNLNKYIKEKMNKSFDELFIKSDEYNEEITISNIDEIIDNYQQEYQNAVNEENNYGSDEENEYGETYEEATEEQLDLLNNAEKIKQELTRNKEQLYKVLNNLLETQKELYELKDEVIKKIDLKPVGYHNLPDGSYGIYYKMGDFSFHLPTEVEEDIKGLKELGTIQEQITSEQKDVGLSTDEAIKILKDFIKDTQYSMQEDNIKDNKGRTLSKEQSDFFKNISDELKDKNGNIVTYYNGSGDFTVFDKNKISGNNKWGKGIYLTQYKDVAELYGDKVKEVYINITNPISQDSKTIFFEQYNDLFKKINDGDEADKLDYDIYNNDLDLLWDMTNGNWADYADEIKESTGKDGIIINGKSKTDDMAIAFKSNQIKNVDNIKPTSDNDIRYSQKTQTWQEHLEKNYKATGTRTYTSDILPTKETTTKEETVKLPTKKTLNPIEISNMTKEDVSTTPILPTKKVKTGEGKSKFAKNIKEKTNMLTEESKKAILSDEAVQSYEKVTNKESLEKAFDRLNKGGKNETLSWLAKDSTNADSVDVAEGWILLNQYQNEIQNEKNAVKKDELNRSMVQVAIKMRDIGTKAGQAVQAFNIMNRLTPEGMVYYAQAELQEAFEKAQKGKTKEWIDQYKDNFKLNSSETQFIMDTMKEIQGMPDGYDKKVKLAEIQKVMTDKLPPSKGAGLKAWMRISMLFNPKTQVRNVLGNAVVLPVNYGADLIGSAIDKQIAKKTGVRTTGSNYSSYKKGFKEGVYQSYNDFRKGINTRNIEGNRFEISEGKSFNDNTKIGKALNRVDNLLGFMLDAGDRGFYEASFVNSLNNQMALNNATKPTQDMIEIATNEALARTWQDNNNYTKFVLNIRRGLNAVNVKGYGLGDVLIPFAKTPANLTKAIVDYSPVGLVNSINKGVNLKRSLSNGQFTPQMQKDFVSTLGKATAGSLLYVLGMALAKAKITTGESDDDKDVANFLRNTLGIDSYSIKIGDKSYKYDWAQPIAAPFAVTANLANKESKNLKENIVSTIDTGLNVLFEQSFLDSMSDVLSKPGEIGTKMVEQILDLPSRAVPTFLKQISDMIDSTQRSSFEYDKPLETAKNKIKSKIPFLTKNLAPSVDTLGRDIQKYGGKNNIFNVFLNPANVRTGNPSESAREIYRLYEKNGDKSIMPRVAPYYINQDGSKVILTSKEKAEFQKVSGEIIEKEVQKLLNNSSYRNQSDKLKEEIVKDVVNYSYNVAKEKVVGISMSDTYKTVNGYVELGGKPSDYYTIKEQISVTKADDNLSDNEKKTDVGQAIIDSDISDKEKAYIYGKYYSSDKTLDLIVDSKISVDEFIKFNSQTFESDYYRNGKTVPNSKKNKVINYVNSLKLTPVKKAILIKMNYNSFDNYNKSIVDYINKMDYSKFEKATMLKQIGFDNFDKYVINEVNGRNISKDEKIEILKDLGFSIRNGRVYK